MPYSIKEQLKVINNYQELMSNKRNKRAVSKHNAERAENYKQWVKKWATRDKRNILTSLFSFHLAENGRNIRSYVLSTFKSSTQKLDLFYTNRFCLVKRREKLVSILLL